MKTEAAATKTVKTADPKAVKDREAAKACGLGLVDYRVLRAIAKAGEALTYRQIEKATGYYSTLTAVLRAGKDDSLCARGLTKETSVETDAGGEVLAFAVTAKGKQALAKAAPKPAK